MNGHVIHLVLANVINQSSLQVKMQTLFDPVHVHEFWHGAARKNSLLRIFVLQLSKIYCKGPIFWLIGKAILLSAALTDSFAFFWFSDRYSRPSARFQSTRSTWRRWWSKPKSSPRFWRVSAIPTSTCARMSRRLFAKSPSTLLRFVRQNLCQTRFASDMSCTTGLDRFMCDVKFFSCFSFFVVLHLHQSFFSNCMS